jgi:hypothetical protein
MASRHKAYSTGVQWCNLFSDRPRVSLVGRAMVLAFQWKGHGPCAPGCQGAPSNSAQETRGTRNNPILLLFIREGRYISI